MSTISQIFIDRLMADACTDYIRMDYDSVTTVQASADDFLSSYSYTEGKKYIKILRNGSVWGFIVNVENDDKFTFGDILKPANHKAPARNKARGNVFTGYQVEWTGPKYLR